MTYERRKKALFELWKEQFGSMLTGQRALDNFSYERLIWHIHGALNKNMPAGLDDLPSTKELDEERK